MKHQLIALWICCIFCRILNYSLVNMFFLWIYSCTIVTNKKNPDRNYIEIHQCFVLLLLFVIVIAHHFNRPYSAILKTHKSRFPVDVLKYPLPICGICIRKRRFLGVIFGYLIPLNRAAVIIVTHWELHGIKSTIACQQFCDWDDTSSANVPCDCHSDIWHSNSITCNTIKSVQTTDKSYESVLLDMHICW